MRSDRATGTHVALSFICYINMSDLMPGVWRLTATHPNHPINSISFLVITQFLVRNFIVIKSVAKIKKNYFLASQLSLGNFFVPIAKKRLLVFSVQEK